MVFLQQAAQMVTRLLIRNQQQDRCRLILTDQFFSGIGCSWGKSSRLVSGFWKLLEKKAWKREQSKHNSPRLQMKRPHGESSWGQQRESARKEEKLSDDFFSYAHQIMQRLSQRKRNITYSN
jgi:hypothetical protein